MTDAASPPDTKPVALITGGSRGLGAAMAVALAPDYHIVAVARTTGALEEVDDRIRAKGGHATLAPMDVTDPDAMAHLCRDIYDRWGGAALWCHTAIFPPPMTPADHIDQKDWDKCMAVNVSATKTLIFMVAPLIGRKGRAVFFEDPRPGLKFFGAYGASKAAQIALARSWQAETLRTGPRVDIVEPRPMRTALRARFFPGEDRTTQADPWEEGARLRETLKL